MNIASYYKVLQDIHACMREFEKGVMFLLLHMSNGVEIPGHCSVNVR